MRRGADVQRDPPLTAKDQAAEPDGADARPRQLVIDRRRFSTVLRKAAAGRPHFSISAEGNRMRLC